MVLDAAARGSDLIHIICNAISWHQRSVSVHAFWTKEAKEASWTPFSFHCSCSALKNACTFCAMKAYNSRTKVAQRRTKSKPIEVKTDDGVKKGKPFFLSHRGPPAALSLETLRKDLSRWMKEAKLDERWTPHDLRGAVASKLMNLHAGEDRVLQMGRWKSKATFTKHYYKPAFYAEAKTSNAKIPLRFLLRQRVKHIEEQEWQEITERVDEQ